MTKLLPYPLDFIVNYPLGYYAKSLFASKPKVDIVYMVGLRTTSILISNRSSGHGTYAKGMEAHQGAPTAENLNATSSDTDLFKMETDYTKSVNKRFGLSSGPDGVLIVEPTKIYDNLHLIKKGPPTVKNAVDILRSEMVRDIIPNWAAAEQYEWAIFSRDLTPLPPSYPLSSTDANVAKNLSLFLVGIPESTANFYCEWAEITGIFLKTIIPMPFAIGNWAIHSLCKDIDSFFLIIPGGDKHRAFFVINGEVRAYLQAPATKYPEKELVTMIGDTILENHEYENAPKYVWMSESVDFRAVLNKLRDAGLENPILIDNALMRSTFKEDIDPAPLLCDWMATMAIDGHRKLSGAPVDLQIETE